MNSPYLVEYLTLMLVHLQAVMLPGVDFALTASQSLRYGRLSGLRTTAGICCGLLVHISYSLAGVGLLFARFPLLMTLVRTGGALYLIWLAKGLLTSGKPVLEEEPAGRRGTRSPFVAGLLTNLLNPKATLFFFSILTNLVSPSTPWLLRVGYGLSMLATAALWFSLVACLVSSKRIRATFFRLGPWLNRLTATFFLLLALWLLWEEWLG